MLSHLRLHFLLTRDQTWTKIPLSMYLKDLKVILILSCQTEAFTLFITKASFI